MMALRGFWLVLSISVRVSPWQSLLCLLEAGGKALMGLNPLFLAWFATGAIDHDTAQMALAVGVLTAATAINQVLQIIGTHARVIQVERVGFAFDTQVAELTARIPTVDHLLTPRYLDQLQVLRDNQNALGGALNAVLNVVNNVVFATTTVVVAATADWRLVILAFLGIPRALLTGRVQAWRRTAEEDAGAPGRLTHLVGLTTTAAAGAEIRVFGLSEEIRRLVGRSARAWQAPSVRLAAQTGVVESANVALFFGAAIAILAWMTHDALRGTAPVSALVVAIGVIGGLRSVSHIVNAGITELSRTTRTIGRFLWLRDYADSVARDHPGRALPPETLRNGISIRDLSFGYGDRPVLDNVSLELPAGSVVAVVGENGAGKSTLVKLLTGLHRPDHGAVFVDGFDLADLDIEAWRARTSGAFQDYVAFEFIAGESVGIGDLDRIDDEARVQQALRDGAGDDVLAALPRGLSTQLGPTWPGGVDLSGGQWQRLAIARGMMRDNPLLLVLDEPTSALDATAENALFERYAAAARAAGRRGGAVTLLVTHRFSTVAAADLVVVLDRGRVVEVGSHGELLAAGGHYAELYGLQARGYR
jgi:ATP-binding cassette subfamily B protein